MLLRALMIVLSAGQAQADIRVFVDDIRFGVDLPAGFSAEARRPMSDGWSFTSDDGKAQLLIWANPNGQAVFQRELANVTEHVRADVMTNVASQVSERQFRFSALTTFDRYTNRYGAIAQDCDGSTVATFVAFFYDVDASETYQPMIAPLLETAQIGPCG